MPSAAGQVELLSDTIENSPLGQISPAPSEYSPELLFAIARGGNRAALGIGAKWPFYGVDIWNAWELSWLAGNGQPRVATVEIRVPAASPNLIESKSLKLYLNSFSMSRFDSKDQVCECIRNDLSKTAGDAVEVSVCDTDETSPVERLPGNCIDTHAVACDTYAVSPALLRADPEDIVNESLHSHSLRSLCPVTGQPDFGSVLVEYTGPRIDGAALLHYIVSFRQHQDFHETCVERMFLDLRERCGARDLSVYARYQRRGGIDINPFRSSSNARPGNPRLWRQ